MSNRPTCAQQEALVDFLESNPGIARGLNKSMQGKVDTKRKWACIAENLNSLGGACKDGPGWAKCWCEKKCALKKACSERSASFRRTGGGSEDNLRSLCPIEHRMVAVMGGQQFATGSENIAVDPYLPMASSESERPAFVNSPLSVDILPLPASTSPRPVDEPSASAPSTSSGTARQTRRVRSVPDRRQIESDMQTMVQIEQKRVEAEAQTAQALAGVSKNFEKCAEALKDLSKAVEEGSNAIANALLEIARKMPSK